MPLLEKYIYRRLWRARRRAKGNVFKWESRDSILITGCPTMLGAVAAYLKSSLHRSELLLLLLFIIKDMFKGLSKVLLNFLMTDGGTAKVKEN